MNKILPVFFKSFLILITFSVMVTPNLLLAAEYEHFLIQQSSNREQWYPVSDAKLAAARGGFVLPNGIIVNISFDKKVFQNGVETFSSYFQSPEHINLITNGKFNIASELDGAMIQSVIQNNLNNQTLTTINTINVDIQNLNNITHTFGVNEFYTQFVLPNTPQ